MNQLAVKKPKVTHLTSVHDPFDNRIFHKECKTLVEAGYDVALIAPHENDEMVDGVQVRGVAKPRCRSERMTRTMWQVYKTALGEDADCYHFHDPELIPVGLLLKLRRKRVLYDVHEDLPKDVLTKNYIPSLMMRKVVAGLAGFTEVMSATFFDGVVVANPVSADRFQSSKTVTVQNFPDLGEIVPANPLPYEARQPAAIYVGDITVIRGIREMVQAVSLLPEATGVKLILAGKFSSIELETEVRQMAGWKNVDFAGWQSRAGIARLLAGSRVGLVLLHPTSNHQVIYTWKMFEYMAAGIPVVASDFPLWRGIIEGAGCGVVVDPLDPKAIADQVLWLMEHPKEAEEMGLRGRHAVLSRYNWSNEGRKLLELYARL